MSLVEFDHSEQSVTPEQDMPRTVIVGLGKDWDGDELSKASKMTALAVAIDVRRIQADGGCPLVIFSGGHTRGAQNPSEASEMYSYIRPLLDEEMYNVELESQSYSTATNAVEVGKILSGNGRESLQVDRLITNRSHINRAFDRFIEAGITVGEVRGAEQILAEFLENNPEDFLIMREQLMDVAMYDTTFHYLSQYPIESFLRFMENREKGKELLDRISQRRLR